MGFLIQTYALIATVPFITFFLMYYLLLFAGKRKRTAREFSIHITTLLLYTAVSAEMNAVFEMKLGFFWIFIWMLFILLGLGYLQQRVRGALNYKKVIISTSKLSFLSLGAFYILFFLIGIFRV
ncbi:DUF3397 family protein [Tepidibacillus marianensis]|uniref:DUF3397 family protein n=1 Tax=Tepidibacillus marianensis TaxID=3131995 RepID=UPI0030D5BAD6